MSTAALERPRGALHITLWVVQILLAATFLAAGLFKVTSAIPDLVAGGMAYAADLPIPTRIAGASEIVAAFGLILPSALRIQPRLTALAGAGLALVMVLALIMHAARGELAMAAPVNVTLGALSAFVAWGRSAK